MAKKSENYCPSAVSTGGDAESSGGDALGRRRLLVIEPRCRVCRDPDIRRTVNKLLIWRGVPMLVGGRCRSVTYVDVVDALAPINHTLPEGRRITYSSLWVHAKRHYDANAAVGWWCTKLERELRAALAGVAAHCL